MTEEDQSERSAELPDAESSPVSQEGKKKKRKKMKVEAEEETTESSTPIAVSADAPAKKKSKRPSDYLILHEAAANDDFLLLLLLVSGKMTSEASGCLLTGWWNIKSYLTWRLCSSLNSLNQMSDSGCLS